MFKNIVCSIWLHTISNSYFSSKCKLLDYSKISYSLLGIKTKFSNPCSCIEKDFTICYNSRFVLFFFFNFKSSANDFIVPINQHLQVWHLVVWGHYDFTICYNSRFVLFFFFNFKSSANDFIVPRNQHLQVWHLVVWGHYENDVLSMIAYISSHYY